MESSQFVLPSEECPQTLIQYYYPDAVDFLDTSNKLISPDGDENGEATSRFEVSDSLKNDNWMLNLPDGNKGIIFVQNTDDVQDGLNKCVVFHQKDNSLMCETKPSPSETVESVAVTPRVSRYFEWPCSFCLERYPTRNSLTTHMKQHRLPFCIHCLKKVTTINRLVKHKLKMHGISTGLKEQKENTKAVVATSKYGRRRLVFNTLSLLDKDFD